MIALAPKIHIAFNDDSTVSLKLQGIRLKQTNLNNYPYLHVLEEKCSLKSEQRNLRMFQNVMTKICVNKTALSAFHNKYAVLDNSRTCGPFLKKKKNFVPKLHFDLIGVWVFVWWRRNVQIFFSFFIYRGFYFDESANRRCW
jgi:hypothetical protein